jgi:hypothetical protein
MKPFSEEDQFKIPGYFVIVFFLTPNNSEEWIGMRFGLEEDDNDEKVARMRLDNDEYGQINKYNILIGNVSTMDVDINKTTFH